jgi:hypothetical protein
VSLGWYTQSDSLPKLKPVVDVFLDHEDEYTELGTSNQMRENDCKRDKSKIRVSPICVEMHEQKKKMGETYAEVSEKKEKAC